MAKSKGIVKIEGSIDDLTFFQKNGKHFVRRKGGVSAARIANDPNFVRTRENNSEFTGCAGAGKLLRLALGNLIFKAKDSQMTARLHQTMSRIKNLDTLSTRGNRNVAMGIATDAGKMELEGFDFNAYAPLKNVLYCPFTLDKTTGEVAIASIIPEEQLLYPQGATHVSFQASVLALDFETGNSELVSSTTANIPLDMTQQSVTLTPPAVTSSTGVTVFLLLVSFYQEVNGAQYSLKNEDYAALQVIGVD